MSDKFEKAIRSGADAVILDLEDAVAPEAKDVAREGLGAVHELAGRGCSILVRINAPLSADGAEDMDAVAELPVDAIVVPKADPGAIAACKRLGLPLIALVETAKGVLAAAHTAGLAGVVGLMLGPVDLCAELGCTEEPGGNELHLARSQLVLAAAAAGLGGPIDGPCVELRNRDSLEQEIARARRLGFRGKACIHPAQVEAVNVAFSPSEEELAWAAEVVEVFERSEKEGGVIEFDGEMIDRPVVNKARAILARRKEVRA